MKARLVTFFFVGFLFTLAVPAARAQHFEISFGPGLVTPLVEGEGVIFGFHAWPRYHFNDRWSIGLQTGTFFDSQVGRGFAINNTLVPIHFTATRYFGERSKARFFVGTGVGTQLGFSLIRFQDFFFGQEFEESRSGSSFSVNLHAGVDIAIGSRWAVFAQTGPQFIIDDLFDIFLPVNLGVSYRAFK